MSNEKEDLPNTKEVTNIFDFLRANRDVFGTGGDNNEMLAGLKCYLENEVEKFNESKKHYQPVSLGEVVVSITPEGFETMEFVFGKMLKRDALKTKQVWLGMTEEEEKSGERAHEVRVKTMAQLIRREPLRVPDWKAKVNNEQTLAEQFVERFIDEDNESFINQLDVLYGNAILPNEFFARRFAS